MYLETMNQLQPQSSHDQSFVVLDLFAGCGGLALGFEAAGFHTIGYEINADSVATYNRNLQGQAHAIELTVETPLPQASVVIGGPPCQPFSVIGAQKGLHDSRDGFPIFIQAVATLKPDIFLFENVRGLLYRNKWYFDEILLALQKLGYQIEYRLINAVEYGIPQKRERIFVIGHQGNFQFPPKQTHHIHAGEALGDMALTAPPESKFLTPNMDDYIARYEKASFCKRPRDLHLNQPSRTLTCRNLEAATGDMMRIKLPDGRRRRLLVREAARLQSFPDWFEFCGTETSQFNQIGNAVPPLLAYQFAQAIRQSLTSSTPTATDQAIEHHPIQLSLPF
jgi:DNA (cytosine-5)-methyltransferase 1